MPDPVAMVHAGHCYLPGAYLFAGMLTTPDRFQPPENASRPACNRYATGFQRQSAHTILRKIHLATWPKNTVRQSIPGKLTII